MNSIILQSMNSITPVKGLARSRRPDDSESNLDLFPLDVVRVDPAPRGADTIALVVAADGHQYAAKSARSRRDLPLNEWLCYHMCEASGIAVPTPKILRMTDGELVFGSRWVGGTYTCTGILNTPDQLMQRLCSPGRLWAIIAFDLFIQNFDRRIANLVFQSVASQTNVLAIDFSRALLYHPLPLAPLEKIPRNCNTLELAKFVANAIPLSMDECERALDGLGRLTGDHLLAWSQRSPEEWTNIPKFSEMVAWWNSEEKLIRLNNLRERLWDGSLF